MIADRQALLRQLLHQLDEAQALFGAEKVRGRHADIVEEQFRRVLRFHADLVEIASAMEALRLSRLDDDQRRAFRAARGIGLGDDDDQVGELTVADEGLLPVDDILIAVQPGRRLDALQIRSGARLGHRDGADEFAGRHLRQPFPLLLLGAIVEDVGRDDRAVERGEKPADVLPGHLLHQDDLMTEVAAGAPYASGTARHRSPASPASRHVARSTIPPSRHFSTREGGACSSRNFADRILKDNHVFFLEEFSSIHIQH